MSNDYFKKINTEDKAYILGFILADGYIGKNLELDVQIKDKKFIHYVCDQINSTYREDLTYDKSIRRFPRARTCKGTKEFKKHLLTKTGGSKLKKERRFPNISNYLIPYMILGFFDGNGCLSYSFRKDRNKLVQNLSFTSSLRLLQKLQEILDEEGISTQLSPKKGEACYTLQLSNESSIWKLINYIPYKFSKLDRKINKIESWKKAIYKKYTFKIGDVVNRIDKRTASKYNILISENNFKLKVIDVNDSILTLENGSKVHIAECTKPGISNYLIRTML